MRFDFAPGGELPPKYWLADSAFATALSNGLNLLFPEGERFFVRSVNRHLDQIDDPELRERVKQFFGQEGEHANAHQRFFEILRAHGHDVDAFLGPYRRIAYDWIEPRFPAKLALSVTAAAEHFTAVFAEHALETRFFEQYAPAAIAQLMQWHAAEEIEHKDVAFEVLRRVDDRYSVRMLGLVAATLLLGGFWAGATILLLVDDPEVSARRIAAEYVYTAARGEVGGSQMAGAFLEYARPDFHPANTGNDHLAAAYFDEIASASAPAPQR